MGLVVLGGGAQRNRMRNIRAGIWGDAMLHLIGIFCVTYVVANAVFWLLGLIWSWIMLLVGEE